MTTVEENISEAIKTQEDGHFHGDAGVRKLGDIGEEDAPFSSHGTAEISERDAT